MVFLGSIFLPPIYRSPTFAFFFLDFNHFWSLGLPLPLNHTLFQEVFFCHRESFFCARPANSRPLPPPDCFYLLPPPFLAHFLRLFSGHFSFQHSFFFLTSFFPFYFVCSHCPRQMAKCFPLLCLPSYLGSP